MKKYIFALMGLLLVVAACDKDTGTGPEYPGNTPETIMTENIKDHPTFFSFAKMEAVPTFDILFVNSGRDLAIYLNSGPHGSVGVTAKNLGQVDFDASADIDSGFAADTESQPVIGDTWYNYDFATHTVSSKGDVYLVKAADYNVYKYKIETFENQSYTISYALVDEDGKPSSVQTANIPASDGNPGMFNLSTGKVIEKDEWDVAFVTIPLFIPEMGGTIKNPGLRVNSAAGAEIALVEGADFEAMTSMPNALEFKRDNGAELAIGDQVLDYNSENHRLTPPDVVYVVKTVNGEYAKLKVMSYYHPETGVSGVISFQASMLTN